MSQYVLTIAGREYRAEVAELSAEKARIIVNGTEYSVDLLEIGRKEFAPARAAQGPAQAAARPAVPASRPQELGGGSEGALAPLPGLVLQVKVKEGDVVRAGQPVVVMEAMKMENVIPAPHNGTVRKILVKEGDNVGEGDLLLAITRPEMTTL
jgi:biotin carboxyl carrier protein